MIDMMATLKRSLMFGMTLPANRFFKPTSEFFEVLKTFGKRGFIDAGCGLGTLSKEAKARGISMVGIDLCQRPGQDTSVLQMDATQFPYGKHLWPVICRPNHDGWVNDAACHALVRGASVLYVGLDHNIEDDLDDLLFNISGHWPDVGKDGEGMWLLEYKPVDKQSLVDENTKLQQTACYD